MEYNLTYYIFWKSACVFYLLAYFSSPVLIVMNFVIKKYRPRHVLVVTLCSDGKAGKQTCWHEKLFYLHLVFLTDQIVSESTVSLA